MITEHNYATLYYPVIRTPDGPRYLGDDWRQLIDDRDQAKLFVHPGDARRWAERGWHGGKINLAIIEFPFVLEYQDGPVWQQMRYYRDLDTALVGWAAQVAKAAQSSLRRHLWRLRHTRTDHVFRNGRPEQIRPIQVPQLEVSDDASM